jgi:serine/threonine protein kinase/DNA-binding SARP family transcriptional activator/WD40 repeat protein
LVDAYHPPVELRVLGAVEVLKDEAPARLGGPKQRTVLALLAASLGRTVTTDRLIDSLWGDRPPSTARHTLQTYISNLRTELGDVVVREGAGYRLGLDRDQVDATRFEDSVKAAADLVTTRPVDAVTMLSDALALWRGHPYSDQTDVPALDAEGRRLEELRLKAVEDKIEADLALGEHSKVVAELDGLTTEYPFRERFRAQQMVALYRSGRQADALRCYDKARRHLGEELGIEPSPELKQLEQRILEQDTTLDLPAERRVEVRTFLVTDTDDLGSLLVVDPDSAKRAVETHDRILTEAIGAAEGEVFQTTSNGIWAVFPDVHQAVVAAERSQLALARADWGQAPAIGVRMAIDVGDVESGGGSYSGPPINRCGRLAASAHGGQVVLSSDAHVALSSTSRSGWQVKALGDFEFRGLGRSQTVFQLVVAGLPEKFPSLVVDRDPRSVLPVDLGRTVRGYELRELVGTGEFGVVYRAYQPSVGREVALKIVRPDMVNQPAFIRLFEAEAQVVASLEHPHIVSLYDFWRDPDGAVLVMRWMRAGSLRKSLSRGPWSLEPAIQLINQIGSALDYAHRQGVIHRDLKPSNVLLDQEGNGYLADFGIAHRVAAAAAVERGQSPAYLVPEELRGEPLRVTADIYALGLLTFEVLSGRPPPLDAPLPRLSELHTEIPEEVDRVVAIATSRDPESRFPSVDKFLSALTTAAGLPTETADLRFTPARNPYKGLRAFAESDAPDFFGRDLLVGELLDAMATHRLVTVVGPSGVGKSSIVKAGLIPALRAGAIQGSDGWLITDMYPGSYPFEELESALMRVAVERPKSLIEELERDERGLLRVSKQILPHDARLLLLIDQFEELFTLTGDDVIRQRFMDALAMLVVDERSRVSVVLTLRADFFDRPLQHPLFGDLLRKGMVALTAPNDENLVEAVRKPAESVAVGFEPGLVERIIAEVHEQPGTLPLLQYALTELFGSRTSDLLTVPGYLSIGGVVGALGTRAEALYLGLDEEGREAARQVFLRLVAVHESTEDTRRRVLRRELRSLDINASVMEGVLEVFGGNRLLTFDRDPHTRSPTVEVAHEALLSQWPRLAGWINERREDLLLHRRLAHAVEEWETSSQSPEFLLQRGRLHQFESWAGTTDLLLTGAERRFMEESRTIENRGRRRSTRRRWAIVGVLCAAVLVITALAFNARDRARVATARELAAASISVVDVDPQLAMLLGLEAMGASGDPEREAVEAVHASLQANRLLAAAEWPSDRAVATQLAVASSPDATKLAVSADGAQIDIWDSDTNTYLTTIGESVTGAIGLAWPMIDWHGTRLAALGPDGVLRVWDSDSGREIGRVQADPGAVVATVPNPNSVSTEEVLAALADLELRGVQVDLIENESISVRAYAVADGVQDELESALAIAAGTGPGEIVMTTNGIGPGITEFAPDGSLIATAHMVGSPVEVNPTQLRLWDADTLELVWEAPYDGILNVAFSPDGEFIAVARFASSSDTGFVDVRDTASGESLVRFETDDFASSIAVAPDGTLIVGHWNGEVSFHDRRNGEETADRWQVDEPAAVAVHSPEGSLIAINDEIWDLESGTRILSLNVDAARVRFTDDGQQILTGGGDMVGRMWALPPQPGPGELFSFSPSPAVQAIDLSQDGSTMAILALDGPFPATGDAQVRSVSDLTLIASIPNRTGYDVALSPDASVVAAFGDDGFGLWRSDGTPLFPKLEASEELIGTEGGSGIDFSPDGVLVAGIGSTGLAGLWEVQTGELIGELWRASATQGFDLYFSQDGSMLATTSNDSEAKIWSVPDVGLLETIPFDGFTGDVFFPTGESVIVLHQHGFTIVDLESGDGTDLDSGFSVHGDLSPDGRILAIASEDGIDLWDLTSEQVTATLRGHNGGVTGGDTGGVVDIRFQPGGRHLITGGGSTVRSWTIAADELAALARQRIRRPLTETECQTYLHVDACPDG